MTKHKQLFILYTNVNFDEIKDFKYQRHLFKANRNNVSD